MGPKKEILKKFEKHFSINDPINTEDWKCVVVMAVEKNVQDSFVLKYFAEEAVSGRRQNVKVINFDQFVLKILNDFVNGELPFKRAFLLNFSSVLQEAAECVSKKVEIPVPLLAKVVKALILFFREERFSNIEKKAMGPVDPIKEMANRPYEVVSSKKNKEQMDGNKVKKMDKELEVKVRPPSTTKLESHLLKRGEGVKEDQCINDAPIDGYFDLYVLLTGFYCPDLPLELIKAEIPLHGVLCIDTSKSNVRRISSTLARFRKLNSATNEAQNFWDAFLKILWNPTTGPLFRDTIFQVYVPQKLSCDEPKLREFIFRAISILMYDMSDYKRQLDNYLKHIKLRDVSEHKRPDLSVKYDLLTERKPNECISVPFILENIIFAVSGKHINSSFGSSTTSALSIASLSIKSSEAEMHKSQSVLAKHGSNVKSPQWSRIVFESKNAHETKVYSTLRELDLKYQMDELLAFADLTEKKLSNKDCSSDSCTKHRGRVWSANIEDAVKAEESVFHLYWKNFLKISSVNECFTVDMDTCLYPILATRIFCSYETIPPLNAEAKKFPLKKNSTYELIENLATEMRKPHFTVTQGSRSVLQSIPFNVKDKSKDFFYPPHLKIVTPEMLKISSAPELHDPPNLVAETSFISALTDNKLLENINIHVFSNLEKFLGDEVFKAVNNFDFVEELSKTKLLNREAELWDEYNCVHYNYSILLDSVFVLLHNRKCEVDVRQETFNELLKSHVGLRDFFEYILEDETDWLESEEESYKSERNSMSAQLMQNREVMKFAISDFWMANSLKFQEQNLKLARKEKEREEEKIKSSSQRENLKIKKKVSIIDRSVSSKTNKEKEEPTPSVNETHDDHHFEAYDLADTVAQFSGLKTSYHAKNCSLTVNLLERLYGNQDLGVHANLAGHILHLYSYACPTPHVLDPYTGHVCFKNGIILAFSKRMKDFEDTDDDLIPSDDKGTSFVSTVSTSEENRFSKSDGDFFYDMQLSLPNGLLVGVVRNIVRPCYIKQRYLPQSRVALNKMQNEQSRLFLPNGNVIKMLKDGSVEVLKPDTTIVDAYLNDIVDESLEVESVSQYEKLSLVGYLITTPDGYMKHINRGQVVSWKKYQVLQNSDLKSKTTFFRRKDGTNYMLTCDGTLVVQFSDGTKISSSCFVKESEENFSINTSSEGFLVELDTLPEPGFLTVHMEITVEHPAYATVRYSTETENWDLTLPSDSKVTVTAEGCYFVKIDSQTDLEMNPDTISMNRYVRSGSVQCSVIANLKVFEDPEREKIYVQMLDCSGKTFVVESNSTSYVVKDEVFAGVRPEGESRETTEAESVGKGLKSPSSSRNSSFLSNKIESPGLKLTRKNKYFAVRKDITGYEIIHREDARKKLTKIPPESVVCTLENPCSDHLSVYILISPVTLEKMKKQEWEVDTTIPDPKFFSRLPYATTSSTYGNPPSWMHPFPKKKKKFKIPEYLTCRIFIETIKSNVVPVSSTINCSYCEMEDEIEERHPKPIMEPEQFKSYISRLSEDNQILLKDMYILGAREAFIEKLKQKPVNTEKLNKYLTKSKHLVEMQNFHKHAIRYHIVSNFFEHPAGMAWLLLNEQLENCDLFSENVQKKTDPKSAIQMRSMVHDRNDTQFPVPDSTSKSTSAYSYEELECNLNPVRGYSYSDLSCRSDISAKTAPAVIIKSTTCSCAVKAARPTKSSPITHISEEPKQISSETDVVELVGYKTCGFDKEDLEALEKIKYDETDKGTMTLEDLMFLGLV